MGWRSDKPPLFPRPPATNRTADFIVQLFAVLVATMIAMTGVTVIIIEILSPETNTDSVLAIETEMLQTILGALIGFLAGKGEGAAQERERTLTQAGGLSERVRPESVLKQKPDTEVSQ